MSDHMPVIKRTESRFRNLFTKEQILVSITAILYSAFILYTSMFGFFPNLIQRSAFVGFALVLAYLTNPHFLKRSAGKSIGWF